MTAADLKIRYSAAFNSQLGRITTTVDCWMVLRSVAFVCLSACLSVPVSLVRGL